jgi:hypothetical protein
MAGIIFIEENAVANPIACELAILLRIWTAIQLFLGILVNVLPGNADWVLADRSLD